MTMMDSRRVSGFCPTCHKPSLFLGEGGIVTCSNVECANPTGADELLQGGEKFHKALKQINIIRSSIIARQTINWSLHIYPLVQALGEAGFEYLEDVEAKIKGDGGEVMAGYGPEREFLEAEGLFVGSLGSKTRSA